MSQHQIEPMPASATAVSVRVLLRVWGERLGVLLIVFGIAGLIQPFVQDYFTYGFSVLLVGTVIFIVASHL